MLSIWFETDFVDLLLIVALKNFIVRPPCRLQPSCLYCSGEGGGGGEGNKDFPSLIGKVCKALATDLLGSSALILSDSYSPIIIFPLITALQIVQTIKRGDWNQRENLLRFDSNRIFWNCVNNWSFTAALLFSDSANSSVHQQSQRQNQI